MQCIIIERCLDLEDRAIQNSLHSAFLFLWIGLRITYTYFKHI